MLKTFVEKSKLGGDLLENWGVENSVEKYFGRKIDNNFVSLILESVYK